MAANVRRTTTPVNDFINNLPSPGQRLRCSDR
jgi:hypothetical protein